MLGHFTTPTPQTNMAARRCHAISSPLRGGTLFLITRRKSFMDTSLEGEVMWDPRFDKWCRSVYPLKPPRWPSAHWRGRWVPGTRDCTTSAFPACPPPRLGPDGLELTAESPSRGERFVLPSPLFHPNCGQTGPRRPPIFLEDLSQTTAGSHPQWSGLEGKARGAVLIDGPAVSIRGGRCVSSPSILLRFSFGGASAPSPLAAASCNHDEGGGNYVSSPRRHLVLCLFVCEEEGGALLEISPIQHHHLISPPYLGR